MTAIDKKLAAFRRVAANPSASLEAHIAAGKRVIGVGPYYAPEELVHAAGAVPFGVWGCMGTAKEAKRYFAPFYCSICQMTLEMGLTGKLDALSGIMVTALCDTLRASSQNWRAGVEKVPMIFVSHPQNRFIEAGRQYALDSYTEVRRKVEECAGVVITDTALSASIRLYNEWRSTMRRFVELAGERPKLVSPSDRVAVINSGYYLAKEDHLTMVDELNEYLASEPADTAGFKRIVLSGIYEDIPAITQILEENDYAVVADDLAKESRAFALQVPEGGDPMKGLADAFCSLEADSLLYDPKKEHVSKVVDIAKGQSAQGVVLLLAKFCDPEEFDAPLITKACRANGIPVAAIEIDQSIESYEQARTQLETFAELLA